MTLKHRRGNGMWSCRMMALGSFALVSLGAAEVNVDKVMESLKPMSGRQASSLLREALTSDDATAAAMGHWTGVREGVTYDLILGADKKYALRIVKGDQTGQEIGSYELNGEVLSMRSDGGVETQAQLKVQGGRMSLGLDGKTLELARAGEEATQVPANPNSNPSPNPGGGGGGGRSLLDLSLPAPEAPPTQGGGGGDAPAQNPAPAPVTPASSSNPFAGGWVGVIKQAVTITLIFAEDGQYAIQLATAQESQQNQGTYRFDGKVLYTLAQGNAQEAGFPYQFVSADSMVMVIEGEQVSMTRQQQVGNNSSSQSPAQPVVARPADWPGSHDPALLGTWTHTERYSSGGTYEDGPTFVLILADDGSYLFSTMRALQLKNEKEIEQGYWSAKDKVLYFYTGSWKPASKYAVNAQGMVLGEGNGKKFFEKKS